MKGTTFAFPKFWEDKIKFYILSYDQYTQNRSNDIFE